MSTISLEFATFATKFAALSLLPPSGNETIKIFPGGRFLSTHKSASVFTPAFGVAARQFDSLQTRWRRVFAGIAQDRDRAFVHYEKGGIAHSYLIELFRLEPPETAVGVWSGYCGPAKSLEEIKQLILEGDCNSSQNALQLGRDCKERTISIRSPATRLQLTVALSWTLSLRL